MSVLRTLRLWTLCTTALVAVAACGQGAGVDDGTGAIIDPPSQCSPDRPDCSISQDFPDGSDLTPQNSAGVRYSAATNSLVIDRAGSLPDGDADGVPDAGDDCPGMPGWLLPCDGDPSNDGIYQTLFYDTSGTQQAVRSSVVTTTADIPKIDVYFLIDATPTMAGEIGVLQAEIDLIILDIQSTFADAQFGLGLYREYPLDPLAAPYSQAPYHHILDLTDDALLVEKAVSTLNTVDNLTDPEAASQALYSIATGQGLGDMVPNRGSCPGNPAGRFGYPCFRPGALHVVMNITDAEMYNGPRLSSPSYTDPPFAPGIGAGVSNLPPVQMFTSLFDADSAATALDLGDLSAQSLTLMGMSTLLSDQVSTAAAMGCDTQSGMPPGNDMDGKDAVITFSFDSAVASATAFANNTHWPGANVALFNSGALDPAMALACDNGTLGVGFWGAVAWPTTAQQYYIVADGLIPAADPGMTPEGAFSLSILHDGDPANPAWLTADTPVIWNNDVEPALLANEIRVASVVTPKDSMSTMSDGEPDARSAARDTNAVTKLNDEWVTALTAPDGEGLDSAVSNTIALAKNDSVYDITMVAVDNNATGIDETDFITLLRAKDCAVGAALECSSGAGNQCSDCDVGASLEFEVLFENDSVSPIASSQVFDFELVVWADDAVEVERIPVRIMVPDSAAHDFNDAPGTNFYRNAYDSTEFCITPPERPDWGNLTWTGSTPGDSTIEFQIRSANTAAELDLVVPVVVIIPTDTTATTLDLGQELIDDGIPNGLPYIRVTAVLNPTSDLLFSPELVGWELEFSCFAAE